MNKLVSGIGLFWVIALAGCQQKAAPPPAPTAVNLFTVDSKSVRYFDNFPATTQALSQVDIHAEVQGYITGIFFTEGTHVRKGQKLYEIDERLYKAAYDQAAANLKVAHGNTVQAQQDADRYQYLNTHNAVAKQLVDHAVIALDNAKNQEKAADQALKTAATNLTYSTITAPFDGTIGFSQVKLGNLVSVGTTLLNTISTDNPMAVDFLIAEAQLSHYQDLQKNKQKNLDSLFTIVLPNKSVYSKPGKISVIDRAVDPQTGTVRVRLVFPNPDQELRVGMSCVVRVHNQETTPQMLIPGKAVVEQMGEYFVFIAKDTIMAANPDSAAKKTDQGDQQSKLRAFQVRVQTGQTIGGDIIITSGLQDGDRIVVDGVQALHDGSVITTSVRPNAAAKGNADNNNTGKKQN